MAHKKDYKPEDIMFPEQRIVQSELVHEMKSSYIDSPSVVRVTASVS